MRHLKSWHFNCSGIMGSFCSTFYTKSHIFETYCQGKGLKIIGKLCTDVFNLNVNLTVIWYKIWNWKRTFLSLPTVTLFGVCISCLQKWNMSWSHTTWTGTDYSIMEIAVIRRVSKRTVMRELFENLISNMKSERSIGKDQTEYFTTIWEPLK